MLALHVDEFLHREALVVRQIDEERLGDDLEVLFDSVSRFQGREKTSLELRGRISNKKKARCSVTGDLCGPSVWYFVDLGYGGMYCLPCPHGSRGSRLEVSINY